MKSEIFTELTSDDFLEKAAAVGTINSYGEMKMPDGSWKYISKNTKPELDKLSEEIRKKQTTETTSNVKSSIETQLESLQKKLENTPTKITIDSVNNSPHKIVTLRQYHSIEDKHKEVKTLRGRMEMNLDGDKKQLYTDVSGIGTTKFVKQVADFFENSYNGLENIAGGVGRLVIQPTQTPGVFTVYSTAKYKITNTSVLEKLSEVLSYTHHLVKK